MAYDLVHRLWLGRWYVEKGKLIECRDLCGGGVGRNPNYLVFM